MGQPERFEIQFDKHIGIGVRWDTWDGYLFPLEITICLPFLAIIIGIGRRRKA